MDTAIEGAHAVTDDASSGWPPYPQTSSDTKEFAQALYGAQLAAPKTRTETIEARYRSQFDVEAELFKNFHTTLRDIGKTTVTRTDSLAQLVQTASAAIVTLYTGVLGFVFVAGGTALPLRALIPAIFLGLAVVLAAAYAAFLTPIPDTPYRPTSLPRQNALAQTRAVLRFVRVRNHTRARAIRAAVVALGLGVLFLPAPFIALGSAGAPAPAVHATELPNIPEDAPAEALPELVVARYQVELSEAAAIRAGERSAGPTAAETELLGIRMQVADANFLLLAALLAVVGFLFAAFYKVPSDSDGEAMQRNDCRSTASMT